MDDKELYDQISKTVDDWVRDVLKSRFKERPSVGQPRSLWDKFKQGVTNWWWGPKGDKYNPYVWRNRFGDELGVSESFNPSVFTLHEYKDIRLVVESVEKKFEDSKDPFDNLRLMGIVRDAAETLKKLLFNALKGRVSIPKSPSPPAEDNKRGDVETLEDPRPSRGKDAPTVSSSEPVADKGQEQDVSANSTDPEAATPKASGAAETIEKDAESKPVPSEKIDKPAAPPAEKKGVDAGVLKPEPENSEAEPIVDGSEELMDYVQIKGKLKGFLKELIGQFPSMFGTEKAPEKNKEVEEWFKGNSKRLNKGIEEAKSSGEKVAFLKDVANSLAGEIGKIIGIDKNKTTSLMLKYLKDGKVDERSLPKKDAEESEGNDGQDDPIDESLGLEAYLFDGDRRVSAETAIKRLEGFMQDPLGSQGVSRNDERVARLNEWWKEEKESIKDSADKSEHLEKMLLSSESYLKKIGLILGKSPRLVKGIMVKHIQKKSSR